MYEKDPTLALQVALLANEPIIVWGEPGTAKTSILGQLAQQWKWTFRSPSLACAAPEDIIGIPIPADGGKCYYSAPADWALDLSLQRIADKPGLLFLDEWSTASPAVQNAGMRVVHERRVGNTMLGSNVRRAAAANPVDTTSGAFDLTAPMSNRFCHLDWQMPLAYWVRAMRAEFPAPRAVALPPDWQTHTPVWRNLVATFLTIRPELAQRLPKDDRERGGAWPSYRSWDMGSRLLAASMSFGEDVQAELLVGSVGAGPATEFLTWNRNLDLPIPEAVLADPKAITKDHLAEDHKLYAILGGVIHLVRKDPAANWPKAWAVIIRIAEAAPDVVLPFCLDMRDTRPVDAITPDAAKAILRRIAQDSGLIASKV